MTTKEKVVTKSIEQVKKRLEEVIFLLEANPLSEIYKIRLEAQAMFDENKTIEQRTSKEFMAKLEEFSRREKEQRAFAEKSKYRTKLIDERVNLENELYSLQRELHHINRNL